MDHNINPPDRTREPCPDRIIDDAGGAFGTGAVGGGAFYFCKGLKNSPKGSRLAGALQNVRMNAPGTAGSFAVWGALFSVTDCSLVYIRQKEDPWNSILAGGFTGGFLQMRQGLRSASRAALCGGALLALFEGFMIVQNRLGAPSQQQEEQNIYVDPRGMPMGTGGLAGMQMPNSNWVPQEAAAASTSSSSSSSSSWFGGLIGLGGKKDEVKDSGAKTNILETFDAPTPPTFGLS